MPRQKKKSSVFLIAGAVVVVGCAALYFSIEMTSTSAFCTSCHEMKKALSGLQTSKHANLPAGKRIAACRDCHLPPWSHPVRLMIEKAYHGAKDVTGHFSESKEFDEPGFYLNMKINAAKTIHNYNCLNCHTDLFVMKKGEDYNLHASLRGAPEFRCVTCHESVAHAEYVPVDVKNLK